MMRGDARGRVLRSRRARLTLARNIFGLLRSRRCHRPKIPTPPWSPNTRGSSAMDARPVYVSPPAYPAYVAPPIGQVIREGRDSAGNYCREYQSTTSIDGRPVPTYGTACLRPDGSWQIVN